LLSTLVAPASLMLGGSALAAGGGGGGATFTVLCKTKRNTLILYSRMSSKQTNKNFGSNRNKLKLDLFWLCFGLFRETENKKSLFVLVSNEPILKKSKQTELF
jgi:hypothetical protein